MIPILVSLFRPGLLTRVSFLVALAVPSLACSKEAPRAEAKPRPVKYAVVGAGGVSGARAVSGSVIARDATQLAFRVRGELAVLNVKMGDNVRKGQLIGKLDDSDYQVALSQAQANYASAKTLRDTAQSSFARVERLFEAGSASQADYESAKGNLRSAQAQLAATGQSVKQARNQREYAVLKSPFAGVVNSVSSKVGESVAAGQAIAIVSRGGELEVAVGVPEGMIGEVKVGTKATITVSALDEKSYPVSVRELGFASENSTYPARVAFDSPVAALRPGMAASAEFELGAKKAELTIPASGVGNSEEGSFAFVLEPATGETFTVKQRPIQIGQLLGESFEITAGLKPGERVATAGLKNLVDGMTVRLLATSAAKNEPQTPQATPAVPEGQP